MSGADKQLTTKTPRHQALLLSAMVSGQLLALQKVRLVRNDQHCALVPSNLVKTHLVSGVVWTVPMCSNSLSRYDKQSRLGLSGSLAIWDRLGPRRGEAQWASR